MTERVGKLIKATIVTFHCVPNYGAMLQAVAMNKLFENYFNVVDVLDYRPKCITENYNLLYTKRIKGFIASVLNVPTNIIKKRRFKRFMEENMRLTPTFFQAEKISVDNDLLILGSDQIWNLDVTKGVDKTYFGKLPNGGQYVIPYAASIGKDAINEKEAETYKILLNAVPNIGVRERNAQSMLKRIFPDKNIDVTLDPTLMVDASVWNHLEKKIPLPDKYVLIFSLNGYEKTYATAEEIAAKRGIPIIEVLGHNIDFLDKRKHRKLATLGPQEFLYAIHHADAVVTDSFHGTAFSIIYQRDLRVIPHKTRGARMVELLQAINAENRLVGDHTRIIHEKIEWNEESLRLLEALKAHSFEFITNAVNSIAFNKGACKDK